MSGKGILGSDMYRQGLSETYRPIPTFVQSLDSILDGGIKPGMITELVGDTGLGKTTFCLQLCLNVQIPQFLQGLDAQAVFIDTENSLVASRIQELAHAFTSHCNSIIPKGKGKRLSTRQVLSRINLFKPKDIKQFCQIIFALDDFISNHPNVRLIVIDSIAFPFYTQKEDFWNRVQPLYRIAEMLHHIAAKHGTAVVLTNNLTTRFNPNGDKYFVPYLGDNWGHIPNQRISLYWAGAPRVRVAELVKSQCVEEARVNYKVTVAGIRE